MRRAGQDSTEQDTALPSLVFLLSCAFIPSVIFMHLTLRLLSRVVSSFLVFTCYRWCYRSTLFPSLLCFRYSFLFLPSSPVTFTFTIRLQTVFCFYN